MSFSTPIKVSFFGGRQARMTERTTDKINLIYLVGAIGLHRRCQYWVIRRCYPLALCVRPSPELARYLMQWVLVRLNKGFMS